MTKDEREQLVAQWLESELEYAEDCRALAGLVSDANREEQLDGLASCQDEIAEALLSNNYRQIEREADQLLRRRDFRRSITIASSSRVCVGGSWWREKSTSRSSSDRWNGIYTGVVHRTSSSASHRRRHIDQDKAPIRVHYSPRRRQRSSRKMPAPRTDVQVKAELDRFVEALGGDRPVGSIVKADCRAYKENMIHVRKLGLATIIKHLSNLSVMFKWFEAQGFIPENSNPVRGLSPNKKQAKKAAQDRRPFTDEELVQGFRLGRIPQATRQRPARYWLPLLCLFQRVSARRGRTTRGL